MNKKETWTSPSSVLFFFPLAHGKIWKNIRCSIKSNQHKPWCHGDDLDPFGSHWPRIKRMGKGEQGVDAGFHIEHAIEWLVADIMVPKSEDQAALRNNAMSNRLVPHAYGASLFPIEPESSLSFDMEPWQPLAVLDLEDVKVLLWE